MSIDLFDRIGLTQSQQSIYLLLLEYGQFPASTIAKRLKLKRTSTYAALDSLIQQSLVTSFRRNKVTYYEARDPSEITSICQTRVDNEKLLLKDAKKMVEKFQDLKSRRHHPLLEVRGELKYYRGKEAVAQLLNEELATEFKEGEREHLNFGFDNSHRFDIQKFIDKRVDLGIYCRTIMADLPQPRAVQARDEKELRKTRLLPVNKIPVQAEFSIAGSTLNLYAEDHGEPIGIRIYNPAVVSVFKSMFELLWEYTEPQNQRK